MKKTLTDLFDEATAQELDLLLTDFEPEPLDTDTMERLKAACCRPAAVKHLRVKLWRRGLAVAACLALLAAAGVACAAEVQEYNTAVEFFHTNSLPTEGLTRGEIKAVYRDITTEAFRYSKTAEVIESSLSGSQIAGFEIPQESPTPEDVEALWNYKNFNGTYWVTNTNQNRIQYQYHIDHEPDPELGFEVHSQSRLEKYEGDRLLWTAVFTEFEIATYVPVSDGVLVYGNTPTWSSEQPSPAWLAKVNHSGEIQWVQRLHRETDGLFKREYISAVLENDDGSYAVFSKISSSEGSRSVTYHFCLTQISPNGKERCAQMTELDGSFGLWNAARFGEGYLVQLGSYTEDEHAKIVRVEPDGTITDSFSYSAEDRYYHVTDMAEFGGNVYLSAYTTPKNEDTPYSGGHYEISSVVDRLFEENRFTISSEELTPMVREIYTAVLLVCDPNGGTPREFYAIEGSLGGRFTLGENETLQWDVESITTAEFSPYTSSHSIRGTSYVYRYTFDQTGNLIAQEKTGQVTHFAR